MEKLIFNYSGTRYTLVIGDDESFLEFRDVDNIRTFFDIADLSIGFKYKTVVFKYVKRKVSNNGTLISWTSKNITIKRSNNKKTGNQYNEIIK